MKAVIYKTLDQKVLHEWTALWEKSSEANYTNAPQWFSSVLETFDYKEYAIVSLYENNELLGIAALVKEKKYGIPVYTVAPTDFICGIPFLIDPTDRKAMLFLGKTLQQLGTIFLNNVPEDFSITLKETANARVKASTINYYITLTKDEKGAVLVKKKKRLLRRSEEIENSLQLRAFTGVNNEALRTVTDIDSKSNKQAYGYNAFSNPKTVAFYQSLAEQFKTRFTTYIYYHEDKPIAYQLGITVEKTFFCNQIAFLKEYEMYSIGRSLLIRLIEQLGIKGIKIVDFGSGEDHVKRSLTKEYQSLSTVIIAENKKISTYLTTVGVIKNTLYTYLHTNKTMYSLFRKVKSLKDTNSK